ncbi:MAG: SDR family NAD(P)-dependent oxidoreductase, partial [Roseomonas sp.]|nr:SDR family NAD(P)-dependent oxidoreductase [Roseomonas sp.]
MQALWRNVLITGASSGLGRALAEACAAPGVALHLSGRDATKLEETATACRARGAEVLPRVIDVCDATAMTGWITGAGRLDLVIANAGISAGTGGTTEPTAQTRLLFETNVTGVLNTALPALEVMAAQPPGADGLRGRIAVVSSVAAFVAAPGAPTYCATKAAVQRWAEALDA